MIAQVLRDPLAIVANPNDQRQMQARVRPRQCWASTMAIGGGQGYLPPTGHGFCRIFNQIQENLHKKVAISRTGGKDGS